MVVGIYDGGSGCDGGAGAGGSGDMDNILNFHFGP